MLCKHCFTKWSSSCRMIPLFSLSEGGVWALVWGIPCFSVRSLRDCAWNKKVFFWYCICWTAPFPWRFLIRTSVTPKLFILVKIKIYMPLVYWLRGISQRRMSIFNAFDCVPLAFSMNRRVLTLWPFTFPTSPLPGRLSRPLKWSLFLA